MTDALKRLWDSTEALPKRFDLEVSPDAQMRKFFEEVYEFSKAVARDEANRMSYGDPLFESVDVLVTMMLNLQLRGWTFAEFEAAMVRVANKNDAKTPENYEVRNGLITRKQVQP